MNREAWLTALVQLLRAHFEILGYPLPPSIHVSVGWPAKRALRRTNRRIGECWTPTYTADGGVHIFISPLVDSAWDVAAVLCHELVHAAVGGEHHHNSVVFKKAHRAVGLIGLPTESDCGPELTGLIKGMLASLPPWPHEPMVLIFPPKSRAGSRMKKLTCACGYSVRTTQKFIALGLPICPQGHRLEVV